MVLVAMATAVVVGHSSEGEHSSEGGKRQHW